VRSSTTREIATVATAGGSMIILGAVLIRLVTPVGWLLVLVGALLLFGGPMMIAAWASGALREQDHKVEVRTFVVDLFRTVKPPTSGTDALHEHDAPDRRRP
jgi:hypothetical protein